MSLLKKLAGETAIYGLSSIVGRVLNYLLMPLYVRLFTKVEYGIVSELYALTGFLMVLFIYRMETAFFRYGTEEENREEAFSTALWSVIGTSFFFSLAILVFSKNITAWLDYAPEMHTFVTIFGLILAFDTLAEIPLARLRLEHRAKRFAFVRLTGIAINVGLNLFFLLLCPWLLEQGIMVGFMEKVYHPEFGVGYIFLSNLAASTVVLLLLLPEIRRIKWQFDPRLWRTMFLYAAPLILASLAGIVNEMLDRELLKHLLPGTTEENLAQLGIYSGCYKLAMLMSLFIQAFRYAAEPFFFANAKHKDAKVLYGDVTKYFTIAGAIAFLFVMLYLDLFKLILPEGYWVGLSVVPILLLANLFLGLYYNVSIWYKLTDQTMLGGWIALGGAAITIVLNVWWIPTIGYMGSAWATLICYASMTVACWWWGRKYYPVQYDLGKMALYIGLAVGFVFLAQYAGNNFAALQMIKYGVNTAFFLAFLGVVWRLEKKHFDTI
ncbi:MAG: polysaccharide biosynthesis protein [Lewinellaceae bacterium]|nr:polysaccharide biosynthesis protein [Saprospiraceae bacterium]MCB9337249.1 polysaccharide biosynthesis protein [Lewinellaceae bacterium]